MHKRLYLKILFLLFLSTVIVRPVIAQDTIQTKVPWYLPDHFKLQFAGNIGFISISHGHTFKEKFQTDLFYSYIPGFIYGRHIHTAALKGTFTPFYRKLKNKTISPIIGTSVNFAFSHKIYKNELPHHFPSGYYSNQWVHVNPFIGIKIIKNTYHSRKFKSVDFYAEIGTVDMYLWYYLTSKKVRLYQILNLALGITVYVKPEKLLRK